jgi:HSP20 family protein
MREMATVHDRFNRLFGDMFPSTWHDEEMKLSNWHPAVDIYDQEDKVVIKAELPGVDKKDIQVDLKDRVLTLKGERTHEKEVKEEKFYRKERAYGKFERAFTLPAGLDPEKVSADFKDGVLKIEVPKPEEEKPRKIAVH